ncbi:MAG: hypothetical protein WC785_07205 [Tatlockia sp.]|jgi:hypothetical protein
MNTIQPILFSTFLIFPAFIWADESSEVTAICHRVAAIPLHDENLKLNQLVQSIQTLPSDAGSFGTITHAGIKKTQSAWVKYRDA